MDCYKDEGGGVVVGPSEEPRCSAVQTLFFSTVYPIYYVSSQGTSQIYVGLGLMNQQGQQCLDDFIRPLNISIIGLYITTFYC